MKNLLIITQRVDENDDLLGFFVGWIRELAKHFDRVFVITLAKGNYQLSKNVFVYSLGKERGTRKITRLITFYKLLFTLVPESNGIFAHMSPVFAIASWPAAVLFRKKIILWYLHRSVTTRLKIAEKLCYKIATAAKESLMLRSRKIVETGHGINIDEFKTDRNWTDGMLKILSVGRISKIKNYDTLLEAAKILRERGVDFKIKIIGQPVMGPDVDYFDFIKSLKERLNLEKEVDFVGFVPHSRIPSFYKESDFVIGLTPEGGIDKAILEGMASGCIVLTSNTANQKYLGPYADKLLFDYRAPNDLANKIEVINLMAVETKREISRFLVESVSRRHNLKALVNRLAKFFT